ncbi:MAG: nicotinate-nucleotide--dimethylbenzimidazole phosphoribosyltransferase [Bacteroidales bacterium]
MIQFKIEPVNRFIQPKLQEKINLKTKPLGALGRLEEIALQIGMIQGTLSPELKNPYIIVFAGDHGVVEENVSAYPQEVTFQMVHNFLHGGAAINVFCKQNGIKIKVVDAGVKHKFESHPDLITLKVKEGTNNFTRVPAMSIEHVLECLENGARVVDNIHQTGCNIIGFGEMGIGNTTSASALMHIFTGIDIQECVGKGTGINVDSIKHKTEIIRKAIKNNQNLDTPIKKLAAFGGFEIAQMTGAMLKAAELKMIIMVDGFIASTAFLAATHIDPDISDYAIFCHQSEEKGHKMMLEYMNAKPLISLNMRLGEGTGCAVAYPVIQSAVAFLNEMASFKSAGVNNKEDILVNA